MFIVQVLKKFELKKDISDFNGWRGEAGDVGPDIHYSQDEEHNYMRNPFVPYDSGRTPFPSSDFKFSETKEFWVDEKIFDEYTPAEQYAKTLVFDQENHSAIYNPNQVRVVERVLSFKADVKLIKSQ